MVFKYRWCFYKLVNEFLYNVKIKDQASMYKVFDKKILNGIHLG